METTPNLAAPFKRMALGQTWCTQLRLLEDFMHNIIEEMNGRDAHANNGWILGVCSVVFDIDEGQKLEDCFPQNALSEDEANDIAFHSFPVDAEYFQRTCWVLDDSERNLPINFSLLLDCITAFQKWSRTRNSQTLRCACCLLSAPSSFRSLFAATAGLHVHGIAL
jgi:hypothetical protein